MTKKKHKPVAPENQPHSVGALVPDGGAFRPKARCEIHKLNYVDSCPVCDNTE